MVRSSTVFVDGAAVATETDTRRQIYVENAGKSPYEIVDLMRELKDWFVRDHVAMSQIDSGFHGRIESEIMMVNGNVVRVESGTHQKTKFKIKELRA